MKRSKNTMIRRHVVTLFYHFLKLEEFQGEEFDFAAVFVGSGAPRLTAPFRSTAPVNKLIANGWTISKTVRLGMNGKRGTFSRTMNRRLSHWQYAYAVALLERRCEIEGVRLERKDPWKTSQRCPACGRWDKRNRRGDEFCCVFCDYSDHADFKAAKTLELLELAGVYGLRSLPSLTFDSVQN
jgi:hypothetical protein